MSNRLFKISYIISTKNRLTFLKIIEQHIVANLHEDEEIIIVDGNSTDGSKKYLQDLYNKEIIHQFISEPDINQAHGWNKALLLARGQIIKKIIDDDVHDLNAIRNCAEFMIANPNIDLCISNHLTTSIANPIKIRNSGEFDKFERWKNKETPCFAFSDVSLLIRRSVLSKFGLFDTQFRMMDWEYALRCSFLKAKIAYYTGCNALAVDTPGNVTSTAPKSILRKEGKIGKVKYNFPGDRADISLYSELKIFIGKSLNFIKKSFKTEQAVQTVLPEEQKMVTIYHSLYCHLQQYNRNKKFEIIS